MYPSAVRTIVIPSIFVDELEQQVSKAHVSSRSVYPLIGGCVADSVGDRRRGVMARSSAKGTELAALPLASYSCELRTAKLITGTLRTFFRRWK